MLIRNKISNSPTRAFFITLGFALLLAYIGWQEIENPPIPPFSGKGALFRLWMYNVFGPFGKGAFSLLMSFLCFAMLVANLAKRRASSKA